MKPKKMSQRVYQMIAALIGVGLLVALGFSLNALFASRTQPPPQPVSQLGRQEQSTEGDGLPQEKRSVQKRIGQLRDTAPRAPKDPEKAPTPPQLGGVPFQQGIFESGEYPSSRVVISNGWQGIVNNGRARVLAGAYRDDPAQGLVIVLILSDDPPVEPGWYLTPVKAGAVQIIEAEDLRFTLKSTNGTSFVFDARAGTFAESR